MTSLAFGDPAKGEPSVERPALPFPGTPVISTEEPFLSDAVQASDSVSMVTTSSFSAERNAAELPELPSRLQDRYVFRTILGQGGFGCVFEAWDEVLHRPVAIKLARRDRFDGTCGRQRFLEEARASAKLKHPHIVTVFDSGTDSEGNPFVVFELIAGESLSTRMKRQPLSREETVDVMITVAEAVHAAHKIGLVHRDLKPANILLDGAGHAHVTDFGLAVDENSQREQAGEIAGSPQYMSPEQVRGETQYLDGRTDIWSLGVILYELLVHRRPFTGRDLREIQDEILHREPKPLRQIDDLISPELDRACLRCLTKSVTDRYSSAADLAKELRSSQSPSNSRSRTRWLWPTISMAIAATLVLGFLVFGKRSQLPDEERSRIESSPNTAPIPPLMSLEPARSETPLPPPVPEPGKWFSLLQQRPEVFVWPVDLRNSRWDHRAQEDELWVNCASLGMIKLGEVVKGDYKLQLNLFQSPWVGNVGLFFGGHPVEIDGIHCRRFQLIQLQCVSERIGQKTNLHRSLLVLDDQSHVRSLQTIAGVLLPTLALRDQSLRIFIENQRLQMVEWADSNLLDLNSPALNTVFEPADHFGDFGIYVFSATGVFRRPELLLIQGNL